jgi:hypothetical protein
MKFASWTFRPCSSRKVRLGSPLNESQLKLLTTLKSLSLISNKHFRVPVPQSLETEIRIFARELTQPVSGRLMLGSKTKSSRSGAFCSLRGRSSLRAQGCGRPGFSGLSVRMVAFRLSRLDEVCDFEFDVRTAFAHGSSQLKPMSSSWGTLR